MKCIYLRTNTVNGKQYVGQTNDFKQREYDWKHAIYYAGPIINRARDKYGIDNFKAEVLKECGTQEQFYNSNTNFHNDINFELYYFQSFYGSFYSPIVQR